MAQAHCVKVTTIVVPLNGSPDGERAVPVARALVEQLAIRAGASILLLLALDGPDEPAARDDAQRYLDAVAGTLRPLAVQCEIQVGNPADAIVSCLERTPGAILCMSTHGRVGPMAAVLGNVAEAVLHQIHVRAVMVGPSCEPVEPTPGAPIVLCYDATDDAESIGPLAVELACLLAAPIDVAMVLHRDGTFVGDHDATAPRRKAQAFTDRLALSGVEVRLRLLDGLDPARVIAGHCRAVGSPLALAACHERTPLAARVLGHVFTRIAHHSPCPLLVVPPNQADG